MTTRRGFSDTFKAHDLRPESSLGLMESLLT